MVSVYPGAIDNLTNPTATNDLDDGTVPHAEQHGNANDAIEAIENELGISPKGAAASVKARLDAMDTLFGNKVNTSLLNAASGVATLDSSSKLVQFADAAKINSGTFATARIPLLASSKIDPASGAFPVALIPPLGAAQITSGVFPTARIPGLPGNWITSGTIDAARLPSSVTANANARVVADLAGRDAILVAERVDGMLVIQKDKMIIWVYRADNTSWVKMPNVQQVVVATALQTNTGGSWSSASPLEFDALAGEQYRIELTSFALNSSSSSVGIRYGWSWTGTGTMDSSQTGPDATVVSPNTTGTWQAATTLADGTSPLQPGTGVGAPANATVVHKVYARYVCTGSGKVTLNIAQNTSSPTFFTQIMPGSFLVVNRIV